MVGCHPLPVAPCKASELWDISAVVDQLQIASGSTETQAKVLSLVHSPDQHSMEISTQIPVLSANWVWL